MSRALGIPDAIEAMSSKLTWVDVAKSADNFPEHPEDDTELHELIGTLTPFHLNIDDYRSGLLPVGHVRDDVLRQIRADSSNQGSFVDGKNPWNIHGKADDTTECLTFADWVFAEGSEKMSQVIAETAERWKNQGLFGLKKGWRAELYPVWADPESSFFKTKGRTLISCGGDYNSKGEIVPVTNVVFKIERAASETFGVMTRGSHMVAYQGEGDSLKVWVPRRAATKQTFPSKLDNTVAGGIEAASDPWETMIKECKEEASWTGIEEELKYQGYITYMHVTENGIPHPEMEHIFYRQMSPDAEGPSVNDNEVQEFKLWTISELEDSLLTPISGQKGTEWKDNCASMTTKFLIDKGVITKELSAAELEQIKRHLHRRLPVAGPSTKPIESYTATAVILPAAS